MTSWQRWDASVAAFRAGLSAISTARLILLAATQSGLADVANEDYEQHDANTWLPDSEVAERVAVLLGIVIEEIDARLPAEPKE